MRTLMDEELKDVQGGLDLADAAAMIASMALPPSRKTDRPACAANGWLVATAPLVPYIGTRRDVKGWALKSINGSSR